MTINYTTLLALAKPVTGTETGQWGDVVNDQITSMLEDAVANAATFSVTSGNVTLTTANGSTSQARMSTLIITGTPGTTRNVIAPSQAKIYVVINQSDGAVVIKGAATTGVTVGAGQTAQVAWNGSDFVEIGNYVHGNFVINGNLTVNGNTTLGDAVGDTLTVNATSTFNNANLTLNAGTANGVAYLNGSKVLTTGSALTFDGTNLATTGTASATKLIPTGGTATGNGMYLPSANTLGFSTNGVLNMSLDSSGNLGIGTSSPSSFSGYTTVSVNNATNGGIYNILVNGTETARLQAFSGIFNVAAKGAATNLTFETNGSERMRLDTSGNLGLGVTPNAWWSSSKAMQIGAGTVVQGRTGSADFAEIGANVFLNSSAAATYIATAAASRYQQSGGGHFWYTAPSGTAGNAITFTQAMTLDASGNLFVGATSGNGERLDVNGSGRIRNDLSVYSTTSDRLLVTPQTAGNGVLIRATNNANSAFAPLLLDGSHLAFETSDTERARINSSGNLLVGTTNTTPSSSNVDGFVVNPTGYISLTGNATSAIDCNRTNDGIVQAFRRGGTIVGNVSVTTTATTFNTSSDYRLKNTVAPMIGALAKVALLKPVTYKWNADGSDGEGFIAHELAEVVPQCVTGEKDAVDADGKPVYQGIDTSFLVATLTAAIKEQQALIESLTARVAQLEGK